MLHAFGVAYTEWGWIVVTCLAGFAGSQIPRGKDWLLLPLIIVILTVGVIAQYGKYLS